MRLIKKFKIKWIEIIPNLKAKSKWPGLSKKITQIVFAKCIYNPSFKQNYF